MALQEDALKKLTTAIKSGRLKTWHHVHQEYIKFHKSYRHQLFDFALQILHYYYETDEHTVSSLQELFRDAAKLQNLVMNRTKSVRAKDDMSPFRQMMFSTEQEMQTVLGTAAQNSFVKLVEQQTKQFEDKIDTIFKYLSNLTNLEARL